MMMLRIRSRDGLQRVSVDSPNNRTTVGQLKSLIESQLQVPMHNQTLSTNQNLLLAKSPSDLLRFTDMSNPNTPLSALNLGHGSIVFLAYEGERTIPGPAVFPAGSFGRKMTMDDLIAKQMRVSRQETAHCESVSFDRNCANAFQRYVNESLAFAVKRGGFMYGTVSEQGEVQVDFIYEPPQQGTEDVLMLLRDSSEEKAVDAIAAGLGMRKVGFIFTQTIAQNKKDYTLSNRELLLAAELHAESELKEWVTALVKLEVGEDGGADVHFEAFQLSDMCIRLFKEGWFVSEIRQDMDPKLSVMKKDVVVGVKDVKEVDNDFFLVVVKILDHTGPLSSTFPIENRASQVTTRALKNQIEGARSVPLVKRISDFHVLLFLARFLDVESDVPALAECVLTQASVPEDGRTQKQALSEMTSLEKKPSNGDQVVITFSKAPSPTAPITAAATSTEGFGGGGRQSFPNSPIKDSLPASCNSPEISRFSPSPNKPPKIPTTSDNLLRKRSLSRSLYSKPKSRFGEQPCAVDANVLDHHASTASGSPYRNSPNAESPSVGKITQKTPLMSSPGKITVEVEDEDEEEEEEEEEREFVRRVEIHRRKSKRGKTMAKYVIQWVAILCIVGCLIAGLTIEKLERTKIWGLEFWKWCVLVMVIMFGLLVTSWFMHVVVFLIEINFLLRKKVLYFVHGLKKSVQVFVWIALVLATWSFLFRGEVQASRTATKILDSVTWTLVSLLIRSFLWLLKTLSLKILASNYHVNRFFDRIQESVFHQYVLQTLSGPPLIEAAEKVGKVPSTGMLSFSMLKGKKGTKEKKVIDMAQFHKIKQEKVSAWTMKVLVDAVTKSGLSTISNSLDESRHDAGGGHTDQEITNELDATVAGLRIFRNVAPRRCKYIEEEDFLRFMIKEEVDLFFPLIEGSESGKVDKKAFTEWVVKVYNGRTALSHALNDTKTAVKQLHKLVTGILIVVTIVIWLLLMQIATTKVLVFLSSQLVLAAFMFGNTCKNIFEAIIFVFVMHPFDVGDRCVVDGVPLLVEEMNILTTVFLTLSNEKIFYPNSVLVTKPISNYYRSPDMGDTVEFSIDFATPVEKIGLLKDRIKKYLESNPQHWHPNHNIVVKEIENVNKLKMALYCNHTMNFQEFAEKNKRRTVLMMEIKNIFEDLSIQYYLLPQHVHLHSAADVLMRSH
ncbi:Mechanosensitive ion channel protein 10 [Linum grandiflorum]